MAASGGKPVVLRAGRATNGPAVNNSIVVVDDAVLVLPLAAGTVYLVTGYIVFASNPTADIVWRLSGPAGASGSWSVDGAITNNVAYAYGETSATVPGTATSGCPITGTITVGGTGGDLVVGHAQGTATAVDTLLGAGCWIQAARM